MRADIVVTLSGPDRVGIVEDVTRLMLDLDGNVATSRMVRLGGEFALIMLVSLPSDILSRVEDVFEPLLEEGYKVTAIRSHPAADRLAESGAYRIEVEGADHEGIIHEIAHGLSQRGINIESAETWRSRAPITGTPLFCMKALVAVPADLTEDDWVGELEEAARQANVDIKVAAVEHGELSGTV